MEKVLLWMTNVMVKTAKGVRLAVKWTSVLAIRGELAADQRTGLDYS